MRVDRCDFSGFKVYPSKGKTYVRGDSKVGYYSSCLGLFGGLAGGREDEGETGWSGLADLLYGCRKGRTC